MLLHKVSNINYTQFNVIIHYIIGVVEVIVHPGYKAEFDRMVSGYFRTVLLSLSLFLRLDRDSHKTTSIFINKKTHSQLSMRRHKNQ